MDAGNLRSGSVMAAALPDMGKLLACAVEVASALAYLHARGILHGDLTCNNVLLLEDVDDSRGFTTKVRGIIQGRADCSESQHVHHAALMCRNFFF